MRSRKTILVIREHDASLAARRFVALLCFAEFYTLFVSSGEQYWKADDKFWVDPLTPAMSSEWTLLPLFIGSFVFFLCGRGLWRNRDHWRRWLLFGVLGVTAILIRELWTVLDWATVKATVGFGEDYDRPTLGTLQNAYQAVTLHIPIWLGLIVLQLTEKKRRDSNASLRAPWVLCAILLCLSWIPTVMYKEGFSRATFDWAVGNLTQEPLAEFYTVSVHVGLLFMLAWSLFSKKRIARLLALIILSVNSVILAHEWQFLRGLFLAANRALVHTLPFSTPVEPKILVTNSDLFWLAVFPLRYLFPWLLIAIYAWRVPMWAPADDGTPFPRVYCAKCLYNLHSNKKDRCPECGSDLDMQSQAESTG